jgi:glutathionyl-hydroquinone reductase
MRIWKDPIEWLRWAFDNDVLEAYAYSEEYAFGIEPHGIILYITEDMQDTGYFREFTTHDYLYCEDCRMFVDLWKFDTIDDTGHAKCHWRYVTEIELQNCIHDCLSDGCFQDFSRDAAKRTQP